MTELGTCWVTGCSNKATIVQTAGQRKLCSSCYEKETGAPAHRGLRESFYKAAEGIEELKGLADRIQSADPEFHRRVGELMTAQRRLLIWINEKYDWD